MNTKAETKPKDEPKAETKPAAKKVDPAVQELAEKIFIQMSVTPRPGYNPDQGVKLAYKAAEAFLAYEPS